METVVARPVDHASPVGSHHTDATGGKVKRLRSNPKVRVAGAAQSTEVTERWFDMAIQQAEKEGSGDQVLAKAPRWLHVKVVDTGGNGRPVDVRVPVRLVKWGMKMARTFSPELKDANLDWDAISAMIEEGEQGEIVHVEDEEKHQTIDVWTE